MPLAPTLLTLLSRTAVADPGAFQVELDPADDPRNPLDYIASNALTSVAFALIMIIAISQTVCTWRWGARWMLAMVIGGYTFALGIALRYGLHVDPLNKNLYIMEYLFVVLSPCAFIAADYVLLGRLARHLGCGQLLLISPHKITYAYVASDISTFLIQAIGGSISVSSNSYNRGILGSRIFLGGLAAQLLSFVTFAGIYLHFLYKVYTLEPEVWKYGRKQVAGAQEGSARSTGVPWYNHWHALAASLGLSCVGILIRSAFRVAELSQGYKGALTTSEAFFYGLDTLPLLLATAVFIPFWPGRFIADDEDVSPPKDVSGKKRSWGWGKSEQKVGGEKDVEEVAGKI